MNMATYDTWESAPLRRRKGKMVNCCTGIILRVKIE